MYGLLVGRNRIFGDIFAPPSYLPSGKVFRREEGRKEREERDKERKGGERKKGTKADGKVWRPFLSYRPPNYFRLVNAIFLKARALCIKVYICVTFKNTWKWSTVSIVPYFFFFFCYIKNFNPFFFLLN